MLCAAKSDYNESAGLGTLHEEGYENLIDIDCMAPNLIDITNSKVFKVRCNQKKLCLLGNEKHGHGNLDREH